MATKPLEWAACPKCQSIAAIVVYRLPTGDNNNYCPHCDHTWDAPRTAHARAPHDDSELVAHMEALIEAHDHMTEAAATRLAAETEQSEAERRETKRGAHLRLVPRKKVG
jgi:hypothetical protein